MELAFDVEGRGAPLLLLHGLFASAANWRPIAAELARSHRVYSVDLRNHGRSPAAAEMSYGAMADDVLGLIERESLERPAVVGHSMGGKVAMALALATPWAVGRLVVIDAAPQGGVEAWARQLEQLSGTRAAMPGAPALAGSALAHWMMPRLGAGHAYFDWSCRLGLIALSLHELACFPARLRCLSSALTLHAIVGGRSDCVRPADGAAFQPMFPRSRIDVIKDAGHWVHADRPHDLLARLRALLPARRRAPAARPQPPRVPLTETAR
jgi:pimeloyl-ACP methyl ester carboxylesterase